MLVWVVYESKLGNTAALAKAIAEELSRQHRVRLIPVEEAGSPQGVDLLIIGCPNHRHHQPDGILAWSFKLPQRILHGVQFGVFEIRYKRHYFWQGDSSATMVSRRLQALGARPLLRPASFYLQHRGRALPEIELERGVIWALNLARKVLKGAPQNPLVPAGDRAWS